MVNFGLRPNAYGVAWTSDRIGLLKRLWTDGLSCSQIAAELGGITRSAVIGKVHRLGLAGRANPSLADPTKPRPKKPRPRKEGKRRRQNVTRLQAIFSDHDPGYVEGATPTDDLAIPFEQRKQLHELTADTCRWPVGDPQKPESFFFCGAVPFVDHVYCHAHCRVAYQPARKPVHAWHDGRRRAA